MLISCWSVKGGVGTTVFASALAVHLAAGSGDVLVVDLAGDVAAALGCAPAALGPDGDLDRWLAANAVGGPARHLVAAGAGTRAAVGVPRSHGPPVPVRAAPGAVVAPGVRLLTRSGDAPPPNPDSRRLAEALLDEPLVVVDAGRIATDRSDKGSGDALDLIRCSQVSLLVLRPCFLALSRAAAISVRPSAVVLVSEPGRALRRSDVEHALDVQVRVEVPWDPAIARTVDAGLLATRLPSTLAAALRRAF